MDRFGLLLALVLAGITPDLFAGVKKVAVINFNDRTGAYAQMARKVHDAMNGKSNVAMIDQGKVSGELAKKGKSASGPVTLDDAVEIGKNLGAEYVISGTVWTQQEITWIQANLIEVSSKKVKKSVIKKTPKNDDAYARSSEIATEMVTYIGTLLLESFSPAPSIPGVFSAAGSAFSNGLRCLFATSQDPLRRPADNRP